MKQIYLISLIILLMPHFAQASSGVAMHGTPKYDAQTTLHLDYANPNAPKGGTITHAQSGTFDSINPFALKGKSAQGLHLAYDRLMRRVWDEPFTLYPLIAERVEIPEDRSSITIHINKDARFNDGSQITADDILFTYETLKTDGRPNMRRIYKLIDTAEKMSTLSLKFTFGEGYDQETAMIMAMMPVLSKAYWEDRKFNSATLDTPVSSGPYIVDTVDIGKRITYKRNTNYWAKDLFVNIGHHNFDTVTYEYFRDNSVALEAFLKGDIDVRRETDTAAWATQYSDHKHLQKTAFKHGRPVQIQSLIFNTRRPPFNDINVRKALNLAFDGEWINTNLYYGQKKRIKSFFENSELAALENIDTWSPSEKTPLRQNLRIAANILKSAGWETVDGILTNKETNAPFSFEIIVQKPDHEKLALNWISHLKRLGIQANVRHLDNAAFRDRLNIYGYDMAAYHWTSSLSPGTEQYQYWSCEAANQDMRWNFSGVCDTEIDETIKRIPQAKTREDIISAVKTLDKKLRNHILTIPLFYTPTDNYLAQPSIQHPDITPLYGPVLETWWHTKTTKQGIEDHQTR